MNFTEYHSYCKTATTLFEYMNGKINKLNNQCILSIEPYNLINRKYGQIDYPNRIKLFIGNIMEDWNDDWWEVMTKDIYINSVIAWTIAHELSHADQYIQMIDYNDPEYKEKVESYVQRFSYDWVLYNQKYIKDTFDIDISMEYIKSSNLPKFGVYSQTTPKGFYRQTIESIVMRNREQFELIKCINEEDHKYISIACHFRRTDLGTKGVMIKSNNKYLAENIPVFSNLVSEYIGQNSSYSVVASIRVEDSIIQGNSHCDLIFTFQNTLYNGMSFRK